jgi:hypothetical protein
MNSRLGPLFLSILLIQVPGLTAQTYTIEPWLAGPREPVEWDYDGAGTWEIGDGKLMLTKIGAPEGAIRRPAALAIIRMDPLTKATVGLRVRSTAPVDVPQRDLVAVVGYQSPTKFYYVHLAGTTDDVHNGIFLVDGADRRRVDTGGGAPLLRDQAWHDVRVEYDGTEGTIDVFVDHAHKPALSALDATLQEGRVGVGSFDDTGEFRFVRVSGSR